METNVDNVYEDMQMGTAEDTPGDSETNCTPVTSQEEPSIMTPKRKETSSRTKINWSKSSFVLISAAVLISILALSLVAIIVYRPTANTVSEEITQLQANIQRLEIQVNTSQEELWNVVNQLKIEAQNSSLELPILIRQTNTDREDFGNRFNNAESTIDSIRFSQVNLYNKCVQDRVSCVSDPYENVTQCMTPDVAMNVTGYYTLDVRCEGQSEAFSNTKTQLTTSLNTNGGNIWCLCYEQVEYTQFTEFEQVEYTQFTCTLVIVRCPLYQTVYN